MATSGHVRSLSAILSFAVAERSEANQPAVVPLVGIVVCPTPTPASIPATSKQVAAPTKLSIYASSSSSLSLQSACSPAGSTTRLPPVASLTSSAATTVCFAVPPRVLPPLDVSLTTSRVGEGAQPPNCSTPGISFPLSPPLPLPAVVELVSPARLVPVVPAFKLDPVVGDVIPVRPPGFTVPRGLRENPPVAATMTTTAVAAAAARAHPSPVLRTELAWLAAV